MISARHILPVFLLRSVGLTRGDDDPLLMIHRVQFSKEPFQYVWAIPQSRATAVAHFDPLVAVLPVSPHQAIIIASEFIRTQFPSFIRLRPDSCLLLARGLEKNPIAGQVW